MNRQRLLVNGVFKASDLSDAVALALEAQADAALAAMPAALLALPRDQVPLRSFDTVGLPALRGLLSESPTGHVATAAVAPPTQLDAASLGALCDDLAAAGHGLIMVMGKGGVGKTTIAAALAIGLVQRGHAVHLTTTDPAAHVLPTVQGDLPGLRVDCIDPKRETELYIAKIMAARGRTLDEAGRALLLEGFAITVHRGGGGVPCVLARGQRSAQCFCGEGHRATGHSLLLMDATGAYHRQMMREFEGRNSAGRVLTPLMRLQDPQHTRIIIATLAEQTPVSQGGGLAKRPQARRIKPYAWVINRSLLAAGARDPLLRRA